MIEKTSSEIQDIFCLDRNDVRRLESDGVLKPFKSGQGKATVFGAEDIDKLLDIKMYLLAGFKISDMSSIFTADYDSDERIREQIHIYKKRVQMLEFICLMRSDLKKFEELDHKELIKSGQKTAENSNLPEYGTDEYFDVFWEFIKLIFIVDFLSQKESFNSGTAIIRKKALDAYHIIEHILERSGVTLESKDVQRGLLDLMDSPIAEDSEIKIYVSEWVEEYRNSKNDIMDEIEKETINSIVSGLDSAVSQRYKEFLQHLIEFALDYFIDEEELFCIMKNFQEFIFGLDRTSLEKGIVKMLGGKK